jgi:outer membrane protein OmpA-like peptidoglycan-associated protein/tetratricopeptide (TPR) repeat protein
MLRNILIAFTLLFSIDAHSQWYDPEKVSKKAADIYAQAIQNARDEKYTNAIKLMNDALKADPKLVDAYLSLGGIYANMKNYDESVKHFEKGFALDAVYSNDYYLPFSISLAGAGQFQKALDAVNKFLQNPKLNDRSIKAANFRKKTYQFAIDYENRSGSKNYVFAPVNLGEAVNTTALEYFPSVTIDGKKMIFTKRQHMDEDFYQTENVAGKWTTAKPLPGRINSNFNEGAQNVSQDGEWLLFTGCNFPEGAGSCDLYISYFTKQGWSEPENLGSPVNSEAWESTPSLSPDKRELYFSSNMPGGYGGKDIWVSRRLANGKWSTPENLGEQINTSGDESCPFIHADNQTLYFNSNGHPGYSEKPDIFVTRKTANGWATPENLGFPINTIDDEGSMIVAADGKTAYYASDKKDTRGGLDIYTFELRQDLRPAKTLWVRGRVFDAKTKNGLPSSVELIDVSTKTLVSKLQTDEVGNYLVTLPLGKSYAFNVNRKGYLFYSENYHLQADTKDSSFQVDIPLQPIVANASIVLRNIFFDSKQTTLKPESMVELDRVVQLMTENPSLKIQISGHTDNVGKPADNLKLSTGRATSVVNYLLSKGIPNARLSFKGFGETKPIAENTTEEGRARNRRTELTVISN